MGSLESGFLRRKACWGILLLGLMLPIAGCHRSDVRITTSSHSEQTCIYLLMGFGDREWSGGLDQLAKKLGGEGRYVHVEPYRAWKSVVKEIIRDRPERLVLIGHSHGGVVAIKAARILQEQGISIRLLVLLDVGRPDPIPANVDNAVHYYVVPRTFTFRSGSRDSLEPGNTHTQLTNVAVGRKGDEPSARNVDHLSISDSAAIHKMIADRMAAAGVS